MIRSLTILADEASKQHHQRFVVLRPQRGPVAVDEAGVDGFQRAQALFSDGGQGEGLGASIAWIRGAGDEALAHQAFQRLDQIGLAHAHGGGEGGRPVSGIGLQHQEDGVGQLADAGLSEAVVESAQVPLLRQPQPEPHRGLQLGRVRRRAGRVGRLGGLRAFHRITYTI